MSDSTLTPTPSDPVDASAVAERLRLTGRNDPCPCGAGRKYKKCCQSADELRVRDAARIAAEQARDHSAPSGEPLDFDGAFDDPADDFADAIDIEADAVDPFAAIDAGADSLPRRDAEEPKETAFPPEVERALDESWAEFSDLKRPTVEQMDTHLERLLVLPPEATTWGDLFHEFKQLGHTDLPGVFRRIVDGVPATKATSPSFFYWIVIETFVPLGRLDLVREAAGLFCALDRESCDDEALEHVLDWLLAAGCEAEALALGERFLPEQRPRSVALPRYAAPSECRTVFDLRVGTRLRAAGEPRADADPVAITRELLRDIEGAIHADFAVRAAQAICGAAPALVLTRADFDLPANDVREGKPGWEVAQRKFEALMHVAREAWQIEQRPPGIAFHGLLRLVDAACAERKRLLGPRPSKARGKVIGNLLDCLRPEGLEDRAANTSRSMFGVDVAQAHLLLEAHATLLGFARRHAMIDAGLAERTEKHLRELKSAPGFPR